MESYPLMTEATEALIRATVKQLPIPLVGAVAFDGNKATKDVTTKCLAAFDEMFALIRPTRILEIGTHAGHSACMMLGLTDAEVVSVDIGTVWIATDHSWAEWGLASGEGGLRYVAETLNAAFGNRFTLIVGDSTSMGVLTILADTNRAEPFDLAFIDGDHSYPYVHSDIAMALGLGIRTMILDDYNDENSDSARAAREHGLVMVREWKDLHSSGVSTALMKAPYA